MKVTFGLNIDGGDQRKTMDIQDLCLTDDEWKDMTHEEKHAYAEEWAFYYIDIFFVEVE